MSNVLRRKDLSLLQSFQIPLTDLFYTISKAVLNRYGPGDPTQPLLPALFCGQPSKSLAPLPIALEHLWIFCSAYKPPASASVANLLQITGERGNEFQLFTSLKNSFLFRHNYPATSKKGTIDCRAELAFCCVGSDNRLH